MALVGWFLRSSLSRIVRDTDKKIEEALRGNTETKNKLSDIDQRLAVWSARGDTQIMTLNRDLGRLEATQAKIQERMEFSMGHWKERVKALEEAAPPEAPKHDK